MVQHVEQQSVGEGAGRAVRRAFEGAEAGRDGSVRVGACRRGDTDRELEQAEESKIIRPVARSVGPDVPVPVPTM